MLRPLFIDWIYHYERYRFRGSSQFYKNMVSYFLDKPSKMSKIHPDIISKK